MFSQSNAGHRAEKQKLEAQINFSDGMHGRASLITVYYLKRTADAQTKGTDM